MHGDAVSGLDFAVRGGTGWPNTGAGIGAPRSAVREHRGYRSSERRVLIRGRRPLLVSRSTTDLTDGSGRGGGGSIGDRRARGSSGPRLDEHGCVHPYALDPCLEPDWASWAGGPVRERWASAPRSKDDRCSRWHHSHPRERRSVDGRRDVAPVEGLSPGRLSLGLFRSFEESVRVVVHDGDLRKPNESRVVLRANETCATSRIARAHSPREARRRHFDVPSGAIRAAVSIHEPLMPESQLHGESVPGSRRAATGQRLRRRTPMRPRRTPSLAACTRRLRRDRVRSRST
jgi:hypothetical protein